MVCNCCVFNIQGITHLSSCEECKIIANQISVKYKFKWYEFHIQLIRDYPEIRLIIELFCLVSIGVWIV